MSGARVLTDLSSKSLSAKYAKYTKGLTTDERGCTRIEFTEGNGGNKGRINRGLLDFYHGGHRGHGGLKRSFIPTYFNPRNTRNTRNQFNRREPTHEEVLQKVTEETKDGSTADYWI